MKVVVGVGIALAVLLLVYLIYYYVIPFIGLTILFIKVARANLWKDLHVNNGIITVVYDDDNGNEMTIKRAYEANPHRFMIPNMRSAIEDIILEIVG